MRGPRGARAIFISLKPETAMARATHEIGEGRARTRGGAYPRPEAIHSPGAFLWVLPALVFMIAFIGYPIVYNLILSFQKVDIMTIRAPVKPFIGLGNYKEIIAGDVLSISVTNTILFTVGSLVFQFTIGFALALFFNTGFRLQARLRGIITVAWMVPSTVVALLFKFMLSPSCGILNYILMGTGVVREPIGWLTSDTTALWGTIIANTWIGIPFNMILLSTGITTIQGELYESASIDGATDVQKFLAITLPLLRPAIYSVLVLGFVYTFKVFDLIYVMTNGGPVHATEVLSTYAYKLSLVLFHFSEGAAAANVLFVCLFLVGLGYLRLIRRDEEMHA
jgi:multiple sugar transport system permease protein